MSEDSQVLETKWFIGTNLIQTTADQESELTITMRCIDTHFSNTFLPVWNTTDQTRISTRTIVTVDLRINNNVDKVSSIDGVNEPQIKSNDKANMISQILVGLLSSRALSEGIVTTKQVCATTSSKFLSNCNSSESPSRDRSCFGLDELFRNNLDCISVKICEDLEISNTPRFISCTLIKCRGKFDSEVSSIMLNTEANCVETINSCETAWCNSRSWIS